MKYFFDNQKADYIQKVAWRLVRSAEDRLGGGKGTEKLLFCVGKMSEHFAREKRDVLEDAVRAAFVNFKQEQKVF